MHRSGLQLLVSAMVFAFSMAAPVSAPGQICDSIATFADTLAHVQEIHVAEDGDDSGGNGSAGSPFASIERAAQDATPGTAIVVHAGSYAGGIWLGDIHGQTGAPIWIGGAPGEDRPVISGGNEGMHLTRPRYVVLHDLEVSNAAYNGVNIDDGGDYADSLAAHHVVVRRLSIHDIDTTGNHDCLKLSGLNDFHVLDCAISTCGGSGIDHVGCHRGLIARCTLSNFVSNAVQCKGGSEDLEIRWCRISSAGYRGINIGGSTGFEYFRPPLSETEPNVEARDIRVLANIFVGAVAPIAFVGCRDCVVANNTIIAPEHWVLRILQETVTSPPYEFLPCGENDFENNLVYFARSDVGTCVNIGPNTASGTFGFANNLWYAHDAPGSSTPSLPAPETDGIYGADPLLADPASGDYTIHSGSPPAGAGLSAARVPGDIAGSCYANPPSIGAYETSSYTLVGGPAGVPRSLILFPARPNPFNPSTTIVFETSSPAIVRLRVYEPSGRLVATLLDGDAITAGRHEVVWDGRDERGRTARSGVYLFRVEAGDAAAEGEMVLVH